MILLDVPKLKDQWNNAQPFPHIVVDNFLDENWINEIHDKFPTEFTFHYDTPIEDKYVTDNIHQIQCISRLFKAYQSDKFIQQIRDITGIEDLEYDPYLHGAGLHCHLNEGKLKLHLDYSIHPRFLAEGIQKERRVNLILYLNKDITQGGIQLWNSDENGNPTNKAICVEPKFNRLVMFRTSDISWHGLPEKLNLQKGQRRISIANYYISPNRNNSLVRYKAQFVCTPEDPRKDDPRMQQLLEIRKNRLITVEDLNNIWPTWKQDTKDDLY